MSNLFADHEARYIKQYTEDLYGLDIETFIDKNGEPVDIPAYRFVKRWGDHVELSFVVFSEPLISPDVTKYEKETTATYIV